MRYVIESTQLSSVMYLRVPPVLKLMLSTSTGDLKTLIYELSNMYIVIDQKLVKTKCYTQIFKTPSSKDYYLIPGNDAKNLLRPNVIHKFLKHHHQRIII